MRFKSLSQSVQTAFAARWADFVGQQPADLLYPIVPVATWLEAFRQLNVRIRANGMPSPESLERATDWVDELLYGPAPEHGTCDCCDCSF